MSKSDDLTKKLSYSRSNFWKQASKAEQEKALVFCEGYKNFLDAAKTERECIDFYDKKLGNEGFSEINSSKNSKKVFISLLNKDQGWVKLQHIIKHQSAISGKLGSMVILLNIP